MTTLTLDDHLAIGQLQARYGHLVDARDWAGLRALLTPDVVLDVSAYGQRALVGIESVMRFYEVAPHPLAHHVTNIESWRDGESARSRMKFFVADATGMSAGGDYIDELVQIDGTWLIRHRVITRRWPPS